MRGAETLPEEATMETNDVTLISDLAESIRQASPMQKDQQAAELIRHLIGSQPDALYFLVQTVLVQREALQRGQGTTAAGAPSGPASEGTAQAATGRGLFGMFGGRQASSTPDRPAPSGGSSFLKTAAAGAVGAAGGLLVAQGISGLFSDSHAGDASAGGDDGWDDDGRDDDGSWDE